jgi:nitrite reductase/ring-hydroxylating ferredoxin subunit
MVVEAGLLADLPEAVLTPVRAGSRDLVLVKWRDRVYALRNICPHMSKSFELGDVLRRATGGVGGPAFSDDAPIITCPWHQYEYSLETGHCLTDRRLRVRSYPTRVEGGRIFIDLDGGRAASRAAAQLRP